MDKGQWTEKRVSLHNLFNIRFPLFTSVMEMVTRPVDMIFLFKWSKMTLHVEPSNLIKNIKNFQEMRHTINLWNTEIFFFKLIDL